MALPPGYFTFQKIEKAADELRRKKENAGLTKEQLVVKAFESRPDLQRQYNDEIRKYGS